MIDAVRALAAELRRVNVPIVTSDLILAAEALDAIDLTQRETVRSALASCLAKGAEYRDTFDALFDLYFTGTPVDGAGLSALSDDALRAATSTALRHGNRSFLREIAAEAVRRFAKMEPGRAVAGTYYIFRTLRELHVEEIRATLTAPRDGVLHGGMAGVADRLRDARADRAVAEFERTVESEVRRRLVADRGADAVAAVLRAPLPTDADFLTASTATIARMNEVVEPLGRRLSRVLAEQSPASARSRLDVRATIRASMSTGGSPVSLRHLPPDPLRPRLVVLADVSGSVAAFAGFALQLAFALKSRFSSVRSFVFVDGVDEVTSLIGRSGSITETTRLINTRGLGVWGDGHSDYGNVLATFSGRHLDAIDFRTTVLILGDARTNYRDPRLDAVEEICRVASRVYWLNPERRALWSDGDSAMSEYAPLVTAAVECRTVRQLESFVETLK
ncbi:VWA domain-containing protein [Microbacterium sp. B19]|uniref:VWA domain-containing protein n=1 Tax=Microbacterium sp. B19 TaxID=96765 RepID=UPI0003474362|nr:VWA domain-containing protein [Microbacterium sp. B19]